MSGHEARRIRETLGLSQRELAERLGVSTMYVLRHERDAQIPKMMRLAIRTLALVLPEVA